MFYSTTTDTYIQEGQQFELNGITYPPQWLNQSTPEQKAAIGLEEVVATNSPANDQYYWVSQTLDGATLTYVNTPKNLADVQKQTITQVNSTAYSLLLPTDWMASKAFETSTPIPTEWATWRASIRTTAADTVTAINAATDVDGVETVMANIVWSNDPNYVAPVENTEVI